MISLTNFTKLFFWAGLTLGVVSCTSTDDSDEVPITPTSNDIKWVTNISTGLNGSDVLKASTPVFDASNTGYYLLQIDATGSNDINNMHDVYVTAIGTDSVQKWVSKITNSTISFLDDNFLAYSDGKIVVLLQNEMICLNAAGGQELWRKNIHREYTKNEMAISNQKVLYVDSEKHLVCFNLTDGTELARIPLDNITTADIRASRVVVCGNLAYVTASDISNNTTWYSKMDIFKIDQLTSLSAPLHTYTFPYHFDPKRDLAVNSKGQALAIVKNVYDSPYDYKLICIDSTGTEVFSTLIPDDCTQVLVDAQDNAYVQSDDQIQKISSTGVVLSTHSFTSPDFFSQMQLLNNQTFYAFVGDNSVSENVRPGIYSMGTLVEQSRKGEWYPYTQVSGSSIDISNQNDQRAEYNTEFNSALEHTVDAEGNLIGVTKNKIYCLKNYNQTLQNNAWSTDFGNLQGTQAR